MCSVLAIVAVAGWFAAVVLWCCLRINKDRPPPASARKGATANE